MTERYALEGLRVLEFAGPFGNYCGKLFADLGAEVVLIEPPKGSELRSKPPFTADKAAESLWFTYHNANKHSVVIHRDSHDDREFLSELVHSADLLIGAGTPQWADGFGLDLTAARARKGLVVTSITPYGLQGPFAEFAATDLTSLAMGGLMSLGGYGDGQPLQAAGEQAFMMANLFAAVGSMIALTHSELTGEGQLVDVSIQECVTMALEHAAQYFDLEHVVRGRQVGMQRSAGAGLYPCADGYVYLFVGGIASSRFWKRFLLWLKEENAEGHELLTANEWEDRAFLDSAEAKEVFVQVFHRFAGSRTKSELYADAQARGIPLAPVRTPSEVVGSEQLNYRDFFRNIVTPEGRPILAPGPPYVLSKTPWTQRLHAPGLGEHTEQFRATLLGNRNESTT